ncbi:LYR motif-containing protein 2 [Sporobolomyces koalae]|uniref:LYR motif-containing protein 2 n=1 Tax=Sporobolomyces koalae TaxID=500713 RepID=UPI00317AB392
MRISTTLLATHRVSRFADKPALPLDYFINRANALSLYRQFIRATKSLGDLSARWETVQWIRGDFERYRTVIESEKSKTLLALGHRQLKQLNATGSLLGGESSKFRGTRQP